MCPLLGLVTRLDGQKGLDLLNYIMDELMGEDLQMVVLGTGDGTYGGSFIISRPSILPSLPVKIMFDKVLWPVRSYASADMLLSAFSNLNPVAWHR